MCLYISLTLLNLNNKYFPLSNQRTSSRSLGVTSLLLVELAEVEHLGLSEFFLHLVDFVSANRVKVKSGQLLLKLLGVGEVVQVLGGAAHEVGHDGLVTQIVVALVVGVVGEVDWIITFVPLLIREVRTLHVLVAHLVLIY